jgi:hypothetical protein
MGNRNTADVVNSTPDVQVVGNPDQWVLLCKVSSEAGGWMKSTKAMEIPFAGCLVQVSTDKRGPDGPVVAEALTFVPQVEISTDLDGRPILTRWGA